MIKDYLILQSSSATKLSQLVIEKIKEGWLPIGGVSASDTTWYSQAMVK